MLYPWDYWPMKYATKLACAAAICGLLGSCAGGKSLPSSPGTGQMSASQGQIGNTDFPVKIGEPYTIGSKTYTPEDVISYDDVGYASFYGEELAGQPTANGEIFVPGAITGAHKTLPLPTYVEVTALETGRTILVRLNDRGPFANDRVIDLSAGAARQLGILEQGVAGVRVRKVNPPEQERAVLRFGQPAAERIDTPDSLLRVLRDKLAKLPKPSGAARMAEPVMPAGPKTAVNSGPAVATPQGPQQIAKEGEDRFIREGGNAPVRSKAPKQATAPKTMAAPKATAAPAAVAGKYFVQVASFSSQARAQDYARKLGPDASIASGNGVYRVRFGPYANEADGQQGLATAKQRGYSQARLFRD
jgi:rare lipoprotein A